MIILAPDHTPHRRFSVALKVIPGRLYEQHRHPAVILDRATGPGTHVWGWWTGGSPARPCLLWSAGRGWGATVVEPEVVGADGYEHASWSHRIKLLDLALARALGPCPTLQELELQVPSTGFGRGRDGDELSVGLLWGVRLLRAAHSWHRGAESRPWRTLPQLGRTEGAVDEELARHALVPTLVKTSLGHAPGELATGSASRRWGRLNTLKPADQAENAQYG